MTKQKITKAVIPVAGLGTRFLPATKAIPKEMITLVDQPLIQYVVAEVAAAGINNIVLVTHSSKGSIEDHFDQDFELEDALRSKGKNRLLQLTQKTAPPGVSIISVRQPQAHGLGHAIHCARTVIGDDDFIVVLPDVLIHGEHLHDLHQMKKRFELTGNSQIMVHPVPISQVSQYGIINYSQPFSGPGSSTPISGIIEKPTPEEAPSHFSVTGRYVLSNRCMKILEKTEKSQDSGEVQLTSAIAELLKEETVEAYHITGKSYDCGSKQGYVEATVDYALRHPELKDNFTKFLLSKNKALL